MHYPPPANHIKRTKNYAQNYAQTRFFIPFRFCTHPKTMPKPYAQNYAQTQKHPTQRGGGGGIKRRGYGYRSNGFRALFAHHSFTIATPPNKAEIRPFQAV